MKKKSVAFLLLLFCCLAFGASAQTAAVSDLPVQPPLTADGKRSYPLGVGDDVELRVLGEADYNGVYTVDEDGKILLPFIETPIMAACKTERELRTEVTAALKKFIREPQVNVRITERRSRPPAVVYGEVRQPQQFDMRRNVTLLELYSYTGGVTEASNGVIKVFHTKPIQCFEPGAVRATENLADTNNLTVPSEIFKVSDLRDGKAESNPVVRPGDIIIFDKNSPVYVVGEVRNPTGVYIPERGLTITELMAMVGGVGERAKRKDIRIYRLKKGSSEREIISVNYNLVKKGEETNVALQPYDIVEVEKGAENVLNIVKGIVIGGAGQLGTGLVAAPLRVVY